MSGPSSYFHVRVFSLSFHTSMMNMLRTYLMSYFHVRDSRSVFLHLLARWPWPSFTFSPGIGRKRLPCKPTGFSILTSTVKGPGVSQGQRSNWSNPPKPRVAFHDAFISSRSFQGTVRSTPLLELRLGLQQIARINEQNNTSPSRI